MRAYVKARVYQRKHEINIVNFNIIGSVNSFGENIRLQRIEPIVFRAFCLIVEVMQRVDPH